MVIETRKLETALGNGLKIIEKNENQSSIVQRRCVRAARDLPKNHKIKKHDLVSLRPAPKNSINPFLTEKILNKSTTTSIDAGDYISWNKIK